MILEKQDSGVCLSTTEPNSPAPTTTITMATADSAQETADQQRHPLSLATRDSPAESRDFSNNHQLTNTNDNCQQPTSAAQVPPDTPNQSSPRPSGTPVNSHQSVEATSNGAVATVPRGSTADPPRGESAAAVSRTPLSNGHVQHITQSSTTGGAKSKSSSRTTPTSTTPRLTGNSTQPTLQTPTKTMGQRLVGAIGRLTGKSNKHSMPSASASKTTPAAAAAAVTTTISPQDQKILTIMRERKAAEMKAREQRDKKHSEWEKDNRRLSMRLPSAGGATAATNNNGGQTTGSSNVRGGRMSLGGRDFVRPQLSVNSNNSSVFESDGTKSPAQPTAGSSSTPERVATPDGSVANSRRTSISSSVSSLADGRWYDPQRMRVLQAQEKKRSVEQRLEQQRREMEEHARQLKAKQEQDLQRANSLRLSRDQQQAMRARLANEKVQQKREMITKQKQQSMTDLSARAEAIDAKMAAAELKAQKLKEEEIQRTKSDLHKRLELSRQRQKQMEEELETWRQELSRFNQWQGDNAEKVAQQNKVMKGVNACKLRLDKEKKQQDNMKKLMTADEKRMAEIEATIETKDSRTSVLLKEKEEVVMRSRERALATKQLRDELRAHYSMNDIDQLNKQVAMENRLMSRVPGSSQTSLNASMTSLA